jgi:hypothetical protein
MNGDEHTAVPDDRDEGATDVRAYLEALGAGHAPLPDLERRFVQVAKSYADVHGIDYDIWLEVGVPEATLDAAGIRRRSRR